MLSKSQKKEYMAIMHEYSEIRSQLEAMISADDNSVLNYSVDTSDHNNNQSSPSTGYGPVDPVATTVPSQSDSDRLAELRSRLQ